MHELHLVEEIIEKVKEEAIKNNAKRVVGIYLSVSEPSYDKESIRMHFENVCEKEPLFKGASLIFEEGEEEGIILKRVDIETD